MLAIARTFTSTVRLLDGLSAFHGDPRVEILFTFDPSSGFRASIFREEINELLHDIGAEVVPWEKIDELDYELMLTASENVDLESLDAPSVLFAHGIGFHKYVPDSRTSGTRLSGLVPDKFLVDKRVSILISHPSQREQLRTTHPRAAERCELTGDITYDRLLASEDLRDHYRDRLGLRHGQRLIVITSTWETESLLGRWPTLPSDLLAELPIDEYRVALVTHPNIRSMHGGYQLAHQMFPRAYAGGLLRIPVVNGWQAALVAADAVIGDHGSVTLYAAALGRPVLLGAMGTSIAPGTPPLELAATADQLDRDSSLRPQIERAIDAHPPERFVHLADRMFARRGQALGAVRKLLYDRLALRPPDAPPPLFAVPVPTPEVDEPRSFTINSRLIGDAVEVWSYPASVTTTSVARRGTPEADTISHLSVGDDEPNRTLPRSASVLVRRRVAADAEDASRWIDETLHRQPHLAMAAVATGQGCDIGLRDGRRVRIAASGDLDIATTTAAAYVCYIRDRLVDRTITVRAGCSRGQVTLTVRNG